MAGGEYAIRVYVHVLGGQCTVYSIRYEYGM